MSNPSTQPVSRVDLVRNIILFLVLLLEIPGIYKFLLGTLIHVTFYSDTNMEREDEVPNQVDGSNSIIDAHAGTVLEELQADMFEDEALANFFDEEAHDDIPVVNTWDQTILDKIDTGVASRESEDNVAAIANMFDTLAMMPGTIPETDAVEMDGSMVEEVADDDTTDEQTPLLQAIY